MPANEKEHQDIELYDEEVKGYTTKQAIKEANRCLHCKRPLCKEGCPISNDIPEFIEALGQGNIGEASNIIARKSNLPAVCGRVCAHELQCEGHCVLNRNGKSIHVGMLERFIADYAFQMEIPLGKVPQKTRGKIAVIGSGPAGLTVAGDLAKMGFAVTIYEEMEEPGGVLLYGIPPFRLPKEVVRREVQRIETLGVTILPNTTVGVDVTAEKLLANGFDALFIGTGTVIAKELDLPGKELRGIIQSAYFLRELYLYDSHQIERAEVPLKENEDVLVIGAGNVALDAARSALKLGAASATIVARGKEENRVSNDAEYFNAIEEGVQFLWETSPIAYEGEKGHFFALRVKNEEKGEYLLPASRLFLAVGSRPASKIVSSTHGIDVDEDGYVIIKKRPYGMTTHKGVFAGGDVVHRPASVVLAMKEAKKVAQGMCEYVDAVKLLEM